MSQMTPKRRRLLQEAARDAEALHKEWRTALGQHHVRIEGQFKELARHLRVKAAGKQPKGLPSAKQAEALASLLGKARIKPAKGRGKDLRRVEQILQDALSRMPDSD